MTDYEGGVAVCAYPITVMVLYRGVDELMTRLDLAGAFSAYEVRVTEDDDDDSCIFSERHLFAPGRDDDAALVSAIQMLAHFVASGVQPALEPHAETLTRLAGY